MFDAIYKRKFLYDCTIEHHTETTSGKFIWPYSLENGMHLTTAFGGLTTKYPGMWELPVHEFVDANGGKITTGLDYNAFINSGMGGSAFCNALKGSLTYHMKTNKCPLFIGMHSDLYAKTNVSASTATDRRNGVESFITYALSQSDVRIVPMKDVITWMRKPVALDQTPIVNKTINGNNAIRVVGMCGNNIEIFIPATGLYAIEFFSVAGKKIFRASTYCTGIGRHSISLHETTIPPGYYIVKLSSAGYSMQQKVPVLQ